MFNMLMTCRAVADNQHRGVCPVSPLHLVVLRDQLGLDRAIRLIHDDRSITAIAPLIALSDQCFNISIAEESLSVLG